MFTAFSNPMRRIRGSQRLLEKLWPELELSVVLDWRILPGTDQGALLARVREMLDARLPDLPEGYGVEVRMAREEQRTYTGVTRSSAMLSPGFLLSPEHIHAS